MTQAVRILYVDDDPDIRTIVEMSLSLDPDIEVHAFGSGAAALAAIDRDSWRPTAIILDYMMPEMDGVTLLAALRRHPDYAQTPVVFMTARGNDTIGPDLIQHAVAGVILKPFDPIELVGTVRALIADPA
jgi:DNA-binding response OmpR family regulator